MDASTGHPDYLVWWQDVTPEKKGDTVTFTHHPCCGAHNTIDITVRFLAQAISGYLMSGDATMGRVVEQYSKGLTATMKGFIWDTNDPAPYLMARNIVNKNHAYTVEGRKKAVVYSTWYNEKIDWNTQRIHFPTNPTWGDVWVHNMRSKDDVPHIFHVFPLLKYAAAYGKEQKVRDASLEAAEWLAGFARDIVDSGYYIRTKDKTGRAYIPTEDLASFVSYEWIDPRAECNAKLNAAFMGYGDSRGLKCGDGGINAYESTVIASHYYNFDIVASWHPAAILNALVSGNNDAALKLMGGLASRVDTYMHNPDISLKKEPGFPGELAHYLVRAASSGLPLTSAEVRLVHERFGAMADAFSAWQYWDAWDASVPDGVLPYGPWNQGHWVSIENAAFILEYCFSPFRNGAGASLADCDVVADPAKWGM
jgi:pterin-4a-carbinolamine dehydratase